MFSASLQRSLLLSEAEIAFIITRQQDLLPFFYFYVEERH